MGSLRTHPSEVTFGVQARSRGGRLDLGSRRVGQSFAGPGEIKRREVVLGPQHRPGEIKSREVELGSHGELGSPLLRLFLNSCSSDIVFATLLRIAVETAVNKVHKLLRLAGSPPPYRCCSRRQSLRSLRVGARGRAIHVPPLPPPFVCP